MKRLDQKKFLLQNTYNVLVLLLEMELVDTELIVKVVEKALQENTFELYP